MTETTRSRKSIALGTLAMQIERDLRERIARGQYAEGSILPARSELATEYGVAVGTVEQAVRRLMNQGVLRAENGRGTFVANRIVDEPILGGASGPQTERTAKIGIITPEIIGHPTDPLDRIGDETIIKAFEASVSSSGCKSHVYSMNGATGATIDPIEAAERAIADDCDGLFAYGDSREQFINVLDRVNEAGVPLVVVTQRPLPAPALRVSYDNVDAGRLATEHLISARIENIIFFSAYRNWWALERLEGALRARRQCGRDDVSIAVHIADNDFVYAGWATTQASPNYEEITCIEAKQLLARGIRGRGVIAANDQMAYGFMRATETAGLKAGRDYAIVGFDDRPASRYCGLTSVCPPWAEMGQAAARLLLDAISNKSTCVAIDDLKAQIIARASTSISFGG